MVSQRLGMVKMLKKLVVSASISFNMEIFAFSMSHAGVSLTFSAGVQLVFIGMQNVLN